ncbi:hypothetical protein PB2503_07874 [Parvularcula bermudensis HTCC2503]|uniref:Uncharacterized protein n=1 Tax=Parvularcula bermudensis (strain ATCC BAA-594 / HTCC2503 / KCTC 12087) TaxID=314260 RepID=E0TH46_PARBH|nr:hypothetical protein [Parvularcula bermudensis]ADM09630.1 hypothetical protein PB2503_07874 [Parvularcula bermudensis HTCC2503]
MQIIFDVALLVISACAALYCWSLSRRLRALQNLRKGVGKALVDLTQSVGSLEAQLGRLRKEAAEATVRLEETIGKARDAEGRVDFMLETMDTQSRHIVKDLKRQETDIRKLMEGRQTELRTVLRDATMVCEMMNRQLVTLAEQKPVAAGRVAATPSSAPRSANESATPRATDANVESPRSGKSPVAAPAVEAVVSDRTSAPLSETEVEAAVEAVVLAGENDGAARTTPSKDASVTAQDANAHATISAEKVEMRTDRQQEEGGTTPSSAATEAAVPVTPAPRSEGADRVQQAKTSKAEAPLEIEPSVDAQATERLAARLSRLRQQERQKVEAVEGAARRLSESVEQPKRSEQSEVASSVALQAEAEGRAAASTDNRSEAAKALAKKIESHAAAKRAESGGGAIGGPSPKVAELARRLAQKAELRRAAADPKGSGLTKNPFPTDKPTKKVQAS